MTELTRRLSSLYPTRGLELRNAATYEIGDWSFISVGGPEVNEVTAQLIPGGQLHAGLRLIREDLTSYGVDESDNTTYRPKVDGDLLVSDYGFVAIGRNPFWPERAACALFGVWPPGIYREKLHETSQRDAYQSVTASCRNLRTIDTDSAVAAIETAGLCFAYIDGCHTAEYVANDFGLVWPKLLTGAAIRWLLNANANDTFVQEFAAHVAGGHGAVAIVETRLRGLRDGSPRLVKVRALSG